MFEMNLSGSVVLLLLQAAVSQDDLGRNGNRRGRSIDPPASSVVVPSYLFQRDYLSIPPSWTPAEDPSVASPFPPRFDMSQFRNSTDLARPGAVPEDEQDALIGNPLCWDGQEHTHASCCGMRAWSQKRSDLVTLVNGKGRSIVPPTGEGYENPACWGNDGASNYQYETCCITTYQSEFGAVALKSPWWRGKVGEEVVTEFSSLAEDTRNSGAATGKDRSSEEIDAGNSIPPAPNAYYYEEAVSVTRPAFNGINDTEQLEQCEWDVVRQRLGAQAQHADDITLQGWFV